MDEKEVDEIKKKMSKAHEEMRKALENNDFETIDLKRGFKKSYRKDTYQLATISLIQMIGLAMFLYILS